MTNPRQEEIDRLARDYEFEEDAKRARKPNGPTSTATLAPLTVEEWLLRPLPEPDHLLGELLSTTCRAILSGPTGLGKTMFGLAAAFAISDGKQFLHWQAGRKCRVLYVDGEISRREMKRRVRDAARRADAEPEGLRILCREDFEDMPPLNTKGGQKWVDRFIEEHGPFDFIFFDNIQALLAGNMKEEEQWAEMLPWVRSLTRRSIGQMWFHHTGHDESKGYGSKAREWQMDVVILMERVKLPGIDLAFSIKFTKSRGKTPDNRDDFEPVTMKLENDEWTFSETVSTKAGLGLNQRVVFGLIADAMPGGLEQGELADKAKELGIGKQRLYEVKRDLKKENRIHEYGGKWFVTASG